MPHCALHLRFSDCSADSCPSAPATADPPSFPRSFELQQTEGENKKRTQWLLTLDVAGQAQRTAGRLKGCKRRAWVGGNKEKSNWVGVGIMVEG